MAGTRSRAHGVFVVIEMAMALVLLVGAGLMIRTLFVLWGVDPGFNPDNVLTFEVSPQPSLKQQTPAAIRAFVRQMQQQLASTPQVESASLSWAAHPMGSDTEDYFWFVGRPQTGAPDRDAYGDRVCRRTRSTSKPFRSPSSAAAF